MTSEQRVPKVKLSVDNASKSYDTKSGPLLAIDDFSMQVGEAEFVCVVGPSGCGKTTLLWSMAGLHSPSRGTVRLDGEPANVVTNDFVKPGNDFDKAKVQADADAYKLSDDMAKVDVEKIRWNFYSNVIR